MSTTDEPPAPPPAAAPPQAAEAPQASLAAVAPALKRGAPLVPLDTAAGRALVAVIAILTFLAALCAAVAQLVAATSAEWRAAVAREATIQIRPDPRRDIDADVARAVALARATRGIESAESFSRRDSERLLEPWLGAGLDLADLPVPRLVVLRLAPGEAPDLAGLRQALAASVPPASLDDHAVWLARLSAMASTIVAVGVALVGLVLLAAGLAVGFATRGAMAGARSVVDVLHFVGAEDAFIAREFQRRFLRLGLIGGLIGSAAALAVIAFAGVVASLWRASPAGEQIEALFGTFATGWAGYALAVAVALAVALVAGASSRLTVRRFLSELR